jgi:3-oxoacyl-[acyl-carrier protein] reductase
MTTWSNPRYDYRGTRVLVTGGIGAGIAAAYRDAGADVTITGTRAGLADYDGDSSGYRYLTLQLTDDASIAAVAAALPELDILVNNAGGNFAVENEYEPEVFERALRVNLTSAYRPGYGAAKGALVQFTKTLAVAWARDRIRVNAVAAGMIVSRMTTYFMSTPELTEPALARTPMRRFGTPDDIAGAVLFLTSDAAAFVTGQTLPVDGYSVMG